MEKTNSYKKYFDILKYIDERNGNYKRITGIEKNQPVSVYHLAEHIGLSNKQTLRCVNEIVSIDSRYKLTKIGKVTAIIKEN